LWRRAKGDRLGIRKARQNIVDSCLAMAGIKSYTAVMLSVDGPRAVAAAT